MKKNKEQKGELEVCAIIYRVKKKDLKEKVVF